jgi:lipooligosaccharide transport system permease protein
VLPLTHAVQLARPLVVGVAPAEPAFHVLVLLGYAAVAFYVALVLTRRRLFF